MLKRIGYFVGEMWFCCCVCEFVYESVFVFNTVVCWFGVCSYRKLKYTPEMRKQFCPLCSSELKAIEYSGKLAIGQLKGEGKYGTDLFMDFREDGEIVWKLHKSRFKRAEAMSKDDYFDFSKKACDDFQAYLANESKREKAEREAVAEKFTRQFKKCWICNCKIVDGENWTYFEGKPVHGVCLDAMPVPKVV